MIYDYMDTDLAGTLILAGDGTALRHLNFAGGKHPLTVEKDWQRIPSHFDRLKTQLTAYLAGELTQFDIPLAPEGTHFQKQVWTVLKTIPYGSTVSYQWVADRIGHADAVRAVGAANGRNPIAIIIPCHRVIGKNGQLIGYGGGLEVKRRLLQLECRRADQEVFSKNIWMASGDLKSTL